MFAITAVNFNYGIIAPPSIRTERGREFSRLHLNEKHAEVALEMTGCMVDNARRQANQIRATSFPRREDGISCLGGVAKDIASLAVDLIRRPLSKN